MRGRPATPVEVRFWRFVFKTELCWLWIGAKVHNGYGVLKVNETMVRAHRLSYELHYGVKLEKGILVCHHCWMLFIEKLGDTFHNQMNGW